VVGEEKAEYAPVPFGSVNTPSYVANPDAGAELATRATTPTTR
jgi:hypothetical protein